MATTTSEFLDTLTTPSERHAADTAATAAIARAEYRAISGRLAQDRPGKADANKLESVMAVLGLSKLDIENDVRRRRRYAELPGIKSELDKQKSEMKIGNQRIGEWRDLIAAELKRLRPISMHIVELEQAVRDREALPRERPELFGVT
jgi:hypothetical protein